ncbi:transposase [Corynebacterium sp. HMSC29G08]|nr:transposase [Corynebacterium sp. HMSC29G08]
MYENDPDVALNDAAEDLGINRTTLHKWVDKYSTGAKTKQLTDAEKIRQLQRENAQLEEECDILRKAVKYFTEQTKK